MQELFDVLRSTDDFLSFFENVASTEQLISRLDQLKRHDPEGLFDCLEELRVSSQNALEANLELSGALTSDHESSDDLLGSLNTFTENLNNSPQQQLGGESPPIDEKSSNPEST
jgi:hypothetical protein